MKKIVVGPKAKGCIDLNKSSRRKYKIVAKALGKRKNYTNDYNYSR